MFFIGEGQLTHDRGASQIEFHFYTDSLRFSARRKKAL
jgi:hypothetical protein